MRTLICMHHFHDWAGSELLATEIFEYLQGLQFKVTLFSPFVDPTFAQAAVGDWLRTIDDPERVSLSDYDLIIVLHQSAARFLYFQDDRVLFGPERPFFAYFHLSPSEPFEAPGLVSERVFADVVFANSEETRNRLREYGIDGVELYNNPAPKYFETDRRPERQLSSLLSVSSHVPSELAAAFDLLRDDGIDVYRIGKPDNPRRIRPYDLTDHDAVVTIGKTAQYAFRSRRPVFCYDHFQGPGWLGADFAASAHVNFSGRDRRVRRSPDVLAREIIEGYPAARDWAINAREPALDCFHLERQLDALVERVRRQAPHRPPCDEQAVRRDLALEKTIYELVDRSYGRAMGRTGPALKAESWERPEIRRVVLRPTQPGEAMVVAAFSFRYDAHLVPDLLRNINGSIHGYVSWDDRNTDEGQAVSDEAVRQRALFEAARSMGADWLFAVDPDERFEDRLSTLIGPMTNQFGPVIWTFDCREMFDPQHYRVGGLWESRRRARLFPCRVGMEPDDKPLHGSWTRNALKLRLRHSGVSFYHLRMASARRRTLRRTQYALLDPQREAQSVGYDYLDDVRGQQLRAIAPSRCYSPPHIDDDGLWASETIGGEILPDPPPTKLRRLQEERIRGGYTAAAEVAYDLARTVPDNRELMLYAADCAVRAGQWDRALECAGSVAETDSESLMACLTLARAHAAKGEVDQAVTVLDQADALAPGCLFAANIRAQLPTLPYRFRRDDAMWRRWIPADAELHEGRDVGRGSLAVVVISLGAPPELAAAVASVLADEEAHEVVVVNSGGGDVLARLADYRDRLRIVTTPTRLFAGACRNIGIDASVAPYVTFLAADCTAAPGSLKARLEHHRAGSRAVSGFVLPADAGSVFQNAASILLHASRHPRTSLLGDQHYSVSYARSLFEDFGYFPPGLRIGEDTYLNGHLHGVVEVGGDEAVAVCHSYPMDLAALRHDIEERASRRVKSYAFQDIRDEQSLRQAVNASFDGRLTLARKALELRRAEFDDQTLRTLDAILVEILEVERLAALREGKAAVGAWDLYRTATAKQSADVKTADALARAAASAFSQSPRLLENCAEIISRSKQPDAVERTIALLEAATALDPANERILVRLMKLYVRIGDAAKAARAFERACQFGPHRAAIWARYGVLPGLAYRPTRIYALQRMYFLNPLDEKITRILASNSKAIPNKRALSPSVSA